jgi:mannonate dehydratase
MGSPKGTPLDSKTYMCKIIKMFEKVRSRIDWGIGLYHDVRESIRPTDAITFVQELVPLKLLFMKDTVQLEQDNWLRQVRAKTLLLPRPRRIVQHSL